MRLKKLILIRHKTPFRNRNMNLTVQNKHARDENILFFEEGHKYTIKCDPDSKYTSVTTWNHTHFSHFDADAIIAGMMKGRNWKEGNKYWGMTPDQIKQLWADNGAAASGAGTKMHYEIECFMNNPTLPKGYRHKDLLTAVDTGTTEMTKEWSYFLNFVKDTPELKPYRTEWLVFNDDLKLAGSIDMVYENDDGTLMIYDWKRVQDITMVSAFNKYALTECISHFHDSNFWHYTLQLNTYKAILEAKYGKKVTELALVRLHPNSDNYELIRVPMITKEISNLFDERLKNI
jgi:hypothetical protein